MYALFSCHKGVIDIDKLLRSLISIVIVHPFFLRWLSVINHDPSQEGRDHERALRCTK